MVAAELMDVEPSVADQSSWLTLDIHRDVDCDAPDELFERAALLLWADKQPDKTVLIDVSLTTNTVMAEINYTYRQKDQPTDVLSFPTYQHWDDALSAPGDTIALGSIVISVDWARHHAGKEPRVNNFAEPLPPFLVDRFLHGCLHISGHHHDTMADYQYVVDQQARVLSALFGTLHANESC